MAKKDDEAEAALWNSRMYTAPLLLEDPKVYLGQGGDLVSPDVWEFGFASGMTVGWIVPIGWGEVRVGWYVWSDRRGRWDGLTWSGVG